MSENLKNKVIVITGACGLIGQEFVKACLAANAKVVLADISAEAGNELIKKLNTENAIFIKVDITNTESVNNLIKTCLEKFGSIDALVNNAYPRNKNYGNKVENVSIESFNENLNMHLGGYYLCMKQFAEYFAKQNKGNVISMGSIYGVIAPRFEVYAGTDMTMPVEYAAIKSAIIHLSKYFAEYYKSNNIRFNTISPGGIFNNQPDDFVKKYNAYAPMLNKTDLNETLIHLLSDASEKITGENFIIDKGWSKV